jgi:hypothetical protein
MKKCGLRIALGLSMLTARSVARLVCPSVQGDRPSHGLIEAPWPQEQHRSPGFRELPAPSCLSAA